MRGSLREKDLRSVRDEMRELKRREEVLKRDGEVKLHEQPGKIRKPQYIKSIAAELAKYKINKSSKKNKKL